MSKTNTQVQNSQFDVLMNLVFVQMIDFVVYLHNSCLIATSITIVGSWKHGHHRSVVLPLISLHNQLMRPGNKVKIVNVGELFSNILAKCVACSSRRDSPATTEMKLHKIVMSGRRVHKKRLLLHIMCTNVSLTDHQDHSKPNHTWAPREALPAPYPNHEHDPKYQCWD